MESECPSRPEGAAWTGLGMPWAPAGAGVGAFPRAGGTAASRGDPEHAVHGIPPPPALIPGSSSPGCPGTRRCRGPGASALPTLPFMALLQPKPKHGLRERSWSLPGAGPEGAPDTPGPGSPAQGAGTEQQRALCHSPTITGVPKNSPAHPIPSAPHSPHPCPSRLPSCLGQPCIPALCSSLCRCHPCPPQTVGSLQTPEQHGTAGTAGTQLGHTQLCVCSQRCHRAEKQEANWQCQPQEPPCLCPPTGCVRTQGTQLNPQCHPQGWLLSLRGSSSSSAPCQPHPGSGWPHRL